MSSRQEGAEEGNSGEDGARRNSSVRRNSSEDQTSDATEKDSMRLLTKHHIPGTITVAHAAIEMDKIKIIDAGNGGEMDKAYRAGTGQFIHQQGPAPQQLEADGVGHVVTALGPVIGACGFSSLAARPEWLESEEAKAFTRAYIKTRNYMNDASAAEIAAAEKPLFPNIDEAVLADCIHTYQNMGVWTRHIDITDDGYNAMLDIFEYDGMLKTRYAYDQVCARPPIV